MMQLEELRRIAESVGEREGWDFSRMRDYTEPAPWDYMDVVRRYLHPSHHVLDVGTGGGEKFLELAPRFGTGIGIDIEPQMIEVAERNRSAAQVENVSFRPMRAEVLNFPDGTFDVVLNRHSVVRVAEVVRVLKPGGLFITQQVGGRNTQSIFTAFGWGPNGDFYRRVWEEEGSAPQDTASLADQFSSLGQVVVARGEYDVRQYFLDVESLVFWLKAVPLPEEFDIERHWQGVNRIITDYGTDRGIETNEHRELLIARKQA
jgi:SAM-dependent methyltransferase